MYQFYCRWRVRQLRLSVLLPWSQGRIQVTDYEVILKRKRREALIEEVMELAATQERKRRTAQFQLPFDWPDLDVEPVDEESEEDDEQQSRG